jgi:hypothetical protein
MQTIQQGTAAVKEYVETHIPSEDEIANVHDLMYQQVNGLPFKNVTCITTHCMSEVGACLVDSVCRDNF